MWSLGCRFVYLCKLLNVMKKCLIKMAAFVVLLWVVDMLVGVGCRFFQNRAQGGDTGRMNYIADQMEEEVLVFGSSRAIHHYDPRILADSLGMSCYNCGRDGNGIIFCYGQYRLFRDRYVPRIIIYDIYPPFDLAEQKDNEKYLAWLRYFYDREGIDSIFWDVDTAERWKMRSMMRRYNEKFIQIVSDAYSPRQEDIDGYRPLAGTVDYEVKKESDKTQEGFRYDTLKMEYWRKLVADCKARGTRLVFAVSPIYHGGQISTFEPLRELAKKEGIPFLYHYGDSVFLGKGGYFNDGAHLNGDGAEAFTKLIVSEIKKCF